jgi:phospholipase B1
MTAGFGMQDKAWVFTAMYEYRGHVASIGLDKHAITFPNFLKLVGKQDLKGGSVGRDFPWDAIHWKNGSIIKPHNPSVDHLNAAQSMAKADRLDSQIDYLLKQLPFEGVDINKDWKVLTIVIGANDICIGCRNRTSSLPENWAATVDAALDKIQKNIPRVFVNLVPLFNISQVWTLTRGHPYCEFVFKHINECPCLRETDENRQIMDNLSMAYNEKLNELAAKWNALQLSDFAVSVQTYMQDMKIDQISMVSDLDCFHPSLLANSYMTFGLWNSMLSPPGKKPRGLTPDFKVLCPSEDTYLQ